jgi:hypothetical protein
MGIKDTDFKVDIPKDMSHGDLASNIAWFCLKQNSQGQSCYSRRSQASASKVFRSLSESTQTLKDNKNEDKSAFSSRKWITLSIPDLRWNWLKRSSKNLKVVRFQSFRQNEAVASYKFSLFKKYLQNQVQNILKGQFLWLVTNRRRQNGKR